MAGSLEKPPRQRSLGRIAATMTLAWWQLRLTWRLLLVTAVGVVAAVILVCTVPFYSQVAMTAGLRDELSTPGHSAITVHSVAHLISKSATQKIAAQIQQELQQNIGQFLVKPQFSLQSPGLQVSKGNQLQLIGWSMASAGAHVKLLEGRLPQDGASTLEVALTSQAAKNLNLAVGSIISVPLQFRNSHGNQVTYPLTLHVVGIFQPDAPGEHFWHGTSFVSQTLGEGRGSLYLSLVSSDSYLAILDAASLQMSNGNPQNGTVFSVSTDLYWYYDFDSAHLDINQLDALNNGLNTVLVRLTNRPVEEPFINQTTSNGPSDLVSSYSDQITVARIPLLSLAYLIAGLMLFFVSLMTDLLVDRQSEAIAVLRSRGASREQIFGSLITQGIGVGIIAFIAGPLISLLLVRFLVQVSLPTGDQGALNVILADPISAVLNLSLTSLVTVVVSILAMVFAIHRASRMDVLALRRESARSTRELAWLRMGLDILAGVIALTGYSFSIYITRPGVLDARTRVLILPPMSLVGAVFLLLGCMLLFLRVFPLILEDLSKLATHARGVSPMLALTQMARTPRQSLRMILLLALAVAFGIFSLVFNASQAQRIPSVAAYQIGADFNGTYPAGSSLSKQSISQQEAAYKRIPGVTSASVGYTSSTRGAESGVNVSIEFRAVDADTFAQTGLWTAQDSTTPLSALMRPLAQQRSAVVNEQALVPAIVDAAAWQSLSLSPGAPFTLSDLNGTVNYIAVAEVNHIPTINDSADAGEANGYVALGGVLVDFASYQAALKAEEQTTLLPSTVWLNTQTDARSLQSVRSALTSGPLHLVAVNDLQEQEHTMGNDPLYLALFGVLLFGTATALLLGLLGNMTVSWLSARSRLINVAIMRALGTAPRQITSMLTYEQVIIYATAIGLGVAFGLLLSFLILPAFVFTSPINLLGGTGVFYVTQSVPSVQMIIPGVLIALAVGILAASCIVVLGMMVRVVSRPALSSMLRLNSD